MPPYDCGYSPWRVQQESSLTRTIEANYQLRKRVEELESFADVKEAEKRIQWLEFRCQMLEKHLVQAEAEIVALRQERDEAKEELRIWLTSAGERRALGEGER